MTDLAPWAACSVALERLGLKSRFQWPDGGWSDFNCQPGITISDVNGGIAWLWTYPGDFILRTERVNSFFELDPLHTGGYGSASITLFFAWVFVTFLAGLR